ncbi:MKK3 [Symbiodinium sp. CCMP2592]|nr:MKK3 [Symbiodinium sp. CCMP2592]
MARAAPVGDTTEAIDPGDAAPPPPLEKSSPKVAAGEGDRWNRDRWSHALPTLPGFRGLPQRLLDRLLPGLAAWPSAGKPSQPTVLILYSTKAAIAQVAPLFGLFGASVRELDICRGGISQDVLSEETFSDLCALALSGDLMAIIGGPNCRTWSILRHFPRAGCPGPVRGRKGQSAWGLDDLPESVLRDTDNDSLLLLRMLLLYHLSLASGPRPPAFLLEHPEDPANQGTSEAQQNCSSWWATAQCKDFADLTRMKIHCFDQCMLGHGARKPTAVLSNLALDWDGLRCRHPDHPVWWSSSDLARWGWQINLELATSLLAFFSTSGDTDGDRSIASALAPVTASTLIVRLGHRSRPLRDGGGKPLCGRLKPEDRCKCKLAWLGQWIEETLTSGTVATGLDQARGCPWPDQWVADLRQQLASRLSSRLHRPVSAEVSPGQPFALDILQALVELAEDPDRDFLQHLREGVPLGVDGPTLPDPNIWPSKQELGNAPKDLEPPAPTAADNYPSAEVFEDTIEKTFLEEKLLDMVAGPLSEQVFLWLLVFVDDFMAVMKESLGEIGAATLMLFLTLLGCPISWHKNALGKVNRWLGYMVNISEGSVWLPEEKLAMLRPALLKLEAGELHTRKEVTSLLGKLQWVAKAYPQVSSHLQPLYAWEQKLERKCRPGDLVRFLATLLISILDSGPCVPLRLQHNTPCYGSSDAGEDDGRVAIGGWFSPLLNPTKAEVLWFSMDVLTTPWVQPLLAHTSPKRRIGALELLGTLILFLLAAESVGPCMIDAHLPLTTDNEGNAFSASKRSSKKWPCSALLMELSAQEFHKGVFAQVTHVKRSSNTWADQLIHFDFEGFSPGNRREVSLSWSPSWMILDKLLAFKSEQ